MSLDANEYTYRMKPLVLPGLAYIIIYPLIVGTVSFSLNLSQNHLMTLLGIYAVSVVIILLIWVTARSKKVIVNNGSVVFRSIAGKTLIEPDDIRKVSFIWTKRNDEIVLLKTGKRTYYLSDLYFPFNELLTDLEEFIVYNNVRSNLSSHYGLN